jgi:antitoxin component YwqK of YwqJK toxin-antitoxin module
MKYKVNFLVITLMLILVISCTRTVKEYYPNGSLKSEYIANKKGIKCGLYKSFFENGKINYIANYRNNRLYGNVDYFDENGTLKYKLVYQGDTFKCKFTLNERGDTIEKFIDFTYSNLDSLKGTKILINKNPNDTLIYDSLMTVRVINLKVPADQIYLLPLNGLIERDTTSKALYRFKVYNKDKKRINLARYQVVLAVNDSIKKLLEVVTLPVK